MENQMQLINGELQDQFLNFDGIGKVQSITMGQLKRTYREIDGGTGEPAFGMFHFQFIEEIEHMCNDFGYKTEYFDMFAANNKDGRTPGVTYCPQLVEKYYERAPETHTLRRVFTNIRILDFDTDEYTTNLSVAYHQKGIQVGFGNNVIICHNQCMLNADLYAATSSGRGGGVRTTAKDLLNIVGSWLTNAQQHILADREKIEAMKQVEITPEQMAVIIGLLTAQRVKHDTKHKEIYDGSTYPLNASQINEVTEKALLAYNKSSKVTCWDLYNFGTDLFKANTMDMPQIMPQNRAYVEFLNKEFNLD